MNEFIATLFLARELAHRYHLSTKSYSQHKALQNFYEDILDLTDDLAEMTQGAHGMLDIPILTEKKQYKEPLYCIAEKLKYVENNRYKAYRKVVDQHYEVLRALKLPTEYQLSAWAELLKAMGLDKKAKSGNLRFVAIEMT